MCGQRGNCPQRKGGNEGCMWFWVFDGFKKEHDLGVSVISLLSGVRRRRWCLLFSQRKGLGNSGTEVWKGFMQKKKVARRWY